MAQQHVGLPKSKAVEIDRHDGNCSERIETRNVLIEDPQVWRGAEMAGRPTEWIYEMSGGQRGLECCDSGRDFDRQEHARHRGRRFSLPQFGSKLAECAKRSCMAAALNCCVACRSGCDRRGRVYVLKLVRISVTPFRRTRRDRGGAREDLDPLRRSSGAGLSGLCRLPYHTDYSDLVGLLCLKARSGRLSSIVSSSALYPYVAERPDLGGALAAFYRTRWGEVGSDRPAVGVPLSIRSKGASAPVM